VLLKMVVSGLQSLISIVEGIKLNKFFLKSNRYTFNRSLAQVDEKFSVVGLDNDNFVETT
jgi:hypothetical protein